MTILSPGGTDKVLCHGDCHVWLGASSLCTCQVAIHSYVTVTQMGDTGHYIAYHPELPTVISQADTPKEARANLVEATEMAVRHLAENGLPVPLPMAFPLAVDLAMMFPGYNPFSPHTPQPTPTAPDPQGGLPGACVPLARIEAAERAGATHLSGDGLTAYTVRYGRVLQSDWDGARFGAWLDIGEEMPKDAVILK